MEMVINQLNTGFAEHIKNLIMAVPSYLVDLNNAEKQKPVPKASIRTPIIKSGQKDNTVHEPIVVGEATTAYVQKAMEGIIAEMATAPNGQRNDMFNKKAFRAGQLGANENQCQALIKAAAGTGMELDEVANTLKSGFSAGTKKAFQVPDVLTEDALGEYFVREHGAYIRYSAEQGMWYIWNPENHRWQPDIKKNVFHMIRMLCRKYNQNGKSTLGKSNTVTGVEKLAKSDPKVAIEASVFDAYEDGINTPSGIVHFDGREKDEVPEILRYFTKSTAVAPESGEPALFLKTMNEIMQGNQELVDFMQQLLGTLLTAEITQQFYIFYGHGKNGKSLLIKLIAHILNDYARPAPKGLFIENKNAPHPTGLAGLQGRRLVYTSELKPDRFWDEDYLKSFVSGDTQTARLMKQDFFEYKPIAKLVFDTNHKPRIRSVDEGWRRRMVIVPFRFQPEVVDVDLLDKLKLEASQILNWMLEGTRKWLANGKKLTLPQAVLDETESYFQDQDLIIRFLHSQHVKLASDEKCGVTLLYHRVREFASEVGEHISLLSDIKIAGMFNPHLERYGLKRSHTSGGNVMTGISLKDVPLVLHRVQPR